MTVSFWLEDAQDDLAPRPPLDGDVDVDVLIVGAGFTGLWTALEVLRRDPSAEVLICEAQVAGFGASGRNGAWLSPYIAVTPAELARRSSPATARLTLETMRATVDEVINTCRDEGIDAQARKGGLLRLARGQQELPAVEGALRQLTAIDALGEVRALDADEVAERVRVAGAQRALFDPNAAAIHPGRLVRGLARAVERRGGRIAEGTPVTDVSGRRQGQRGTATTPTGTVRAETVVLACEAWLSQLPGRHRDLMPVYSLIVLTEPLSDAAWEELGWDGHELLSSHRYTVDYLSRTIDGRILFGGRGAPYHFGSRISPAYDRHGPTHDLLRDQLRTWFPSLTGVRFSHAWGGPLGMPRDWMPTFHLDADSGIGGAYGYTGQGVATSNLAGRVLADLIVTGETEHADLPMVGHRSRRWEPEPLRWLGARYLQRALTRLDARTASSGRPPTGRTLAERLLRH